MTKYLLSALAAVAIATPAFAVEPTPAEKLWHAESSIYWRQRSYQRAEEERQARIGEQLGLNDTMRWRAYAGGSYVRGPYGGGAHYGYGPSIDAAYGVAPRAYTGGVFEPWPYVPGDIYGYTYAYPSRIRQPIGQRQLQTGPNRWESFPVYAEGAVIEVAPPVAPAVMPSLRRSSGPREF